MVVKCRKCKSEYNSIYGVCPSCGERYVQQKKRKRGLPFIGKLLVFISSVVLLAASIMLILGLYSVDFEPAHSYGVWGGSTATCAEDGTETRTCQNCGQNEYRSVLATELHEYGEWQETPPSCKADGIKTRTCLTCGLEETQTIPATEQHTFDEGSPVCGVCGVENPDYVEPENEDND